MSSYSFLSPKMKYIMFVVRAAQIQRLSTYTFRLHRNLNKQTLRTHKNNETILFHNNMSQKYRLIRTMCTSRSSQEDFEEKSFVDTEELSDSVHFDLKSILYNETDDLIKLLNSCENLKELQDVISRHAEDLQLQHRVQIVIVHAALNQRNEENTEIIDETLSTSILRGLEPHISALDINELSCCYLYLRKLNVVNTEPVMRELLTAVLKKTEENGLIPLPALSRLSVAINIGHDFYGPMISTNFLPHVIKHMKSCYDQEGMRLLAICLYNIHQLVDQDILKEFKDRVQELLDTNILNSHTPKPIMKLLHFLNMPIWSHDNSLMIRNLLLALRSSIPDCSEQEIKILSRVFQHHLEPSELEDGLKHALEKQLKSSPAADTLACYMPFTEPTKRNLLISLFKNLLNSEDQWQLPYSDVNFFMILRGLKISEVAVCDKYWDKILKRLENNEIEEKYQQRFLRHCHRYMHFNNNLGGTYRFLPLERKLAQMSMAAIENDLAGSIPWKVSRLIAFVFAYGHTPYSFKKYPNNLLTKVISMADQFSPTDCFYISRGIQICLEMRFRFEVPNTMNMQLSTIDSILSSCVERHLNQELSIHNLNTLLRTLNNRKTLKNSIIYQQAMKKYKTMDYSNLNSRAIRDLAYIFTASNYIEPKALNAMFEYIEKNHEHILGDTVEKVLTCAYNLGFVPQSLEIFHFAARVILRDFDLMSGLSIVQACLALCFYKTIPETLINKVFCVDFIKRIEDEIHLCYSKATYPERVLNHVMQLNRTICLDFPEANVPWFQQNYIEAQLSRKPVIRHKFSDEIRDMLRTLLKDETYLRCNHTTPYGYQIDFVIHFDQKRKPIPAPVETTMLDRITKVAILLLKLDSFCENDLTSLRGPDLLKTKHLEMMGYKVMHINQHDWNSKYMSVPGAKTNYLKCLLQISG